MNTIYISTRQPEEQRIIVVRGGMLTGFEQDIAGWENKKGDIYKAVVTHIEEGLDAAFVNLGESKNGFLPLRYVAPDLPGASGGKHKVAEGDSILVQIKKDHVDKKGAGLTTNISLAGCYLVLMPNTPKDRPILAKNISGRDRQKIAAALAGLKVPEGMGVIVRTAGLNRPEEDLRWDLESYLLKLWGAVEGAALENRGPVLIYRENNLMMRAVRDYYRPGEDQIFCDDADSYHELKNFMELISPENAGCLHYHDGEGAMIPDDVERQIDLIYRREIKTPSGARVVFDNTEAMVAVDVNSAQMRGHSDIEETALRANLEAADAVARHLRLRDIGGLVVVDFIDMTEEEKRKKLEEYFSGLLRRDRARIQWTALSRLGLMELSRQRLSRSVEDSQSVLCQTCHGTGRQGRPEAFGLRLLRHIRQHLDNGVSALVVQAPADTAVYLLNEKRVELRRLEDEGNCEILIAPSQNLYPPDFSIRKIRSAGRVGGSYAARPPDKSHAEDIQKRLQKRDVVPAQPLIKTVMPEERPQVESAKSPEVKSDAPPDGIFARLAKMVSIWRGSAESAPEEKTEPAQPQRDRQRPRNGNAGNAQRTRPHSGRRGGRRYQKQRADNERTAEKNTERNGEKSGDKSAERTAKKPPAVASAPSSNAPPPKAANKPAAPSGEKSAAEKSAPAAKTTRPVKQPPAQPAASNTAEKTAASSANGKQPAAAAQNSSAPVAAKESPAPTAKQNPASAAKDAATKESAPSGEKPAASGAEKTPQTSRKPSVVLLRQVETAAPSAAESPAKSSAAESAQYKANPKSVIPPPSL